MLKKEKCTSRRTFLKTAGVAGISSLVALNKAGAAQSAKIAKVDPVNQKVPTRPFGKSGVNVSILALGGIFDISSNQIVLKKALDWGVTYWDTANSYVGGKSETGIGKFFSRYPEARKDIFLVTKSGSRTPEGMSRHLETSFKRMNTDYIDLFFVHGISDIDELNDKTRAWAEKAKSENKIRLFGFSTHRNMEDCMLGASRLKWIDGIMMSYNFRIMQTDKMKKAVEKCADAGIGLTAMKTQGGGPIRSFLERSVFAELADKLLSKGYTDYQAKIKAVWENPHIASVCSQMANLTVLQANVSASLNKEKLSDSDISLLEQYAVETYFDYCAGCGQICESAVSFKVPICDIMRLLMYCRSYGDMERARGMFIEMPAVIRSRMLHQDYSLAELKCPRKLPIARLVREAVEILS